MHGLTCDRCGETLLIGSDVRYRVRIEVFAAYDPLELTRGDIERDLEAEMADLIETMRSMDPEELESQVYKRFDFDLCPACQRRYIGDPLALGVRRGEPGGETEES